jgi:DNA mismatch repair protein MutS
MTDARSQKVIRFDRIRRSPARGKLEPRGTQSPMPFHSILFERPEDRATGEAPSVPDFFVDLNCDQIVDFVTAGKEEYSLRPFFCGRLGRVDAIAYRHEVMQDLENGSVFHCIKSFAQTMQELRRYLERVHKLYYKEQKEAWFLDAVESYCGTVRRFADELSNLDILSRGFLAVRKYLSEYAASKRFTALASETNKLKAGLATVQYSVLIKGDRFTVRKYDAERDYSAEVEATFEKFKQGAAKDYRVRFTEREDMNHIEAKILEFVAKLNPEIFLAVENYCARNRDFLDQTIVTFDREIQFYVAYLDYISPLRQLGLRFCYPRVSDRSKEVWNYDGFDIALAHKLAKEKSLTVCNDFFLKGRERILVVSGPNQGGKTTFARMFGQLHYLANIGCPVPGREAQLFLFDQLFTHFEKEEKVENLRGKLEDDLIRIHGILSRATAHSIIVMNEIFTSTTIQDETFLSKKVMEKISALDTLCVWVTFVDELASFGPQTVSMVSTVVLDNPALRTFKIVRKPADGLAYALAIAQKYRLTYDSITERIKS